MASSQSSPEPFPLRLPARMSAISGASVWLEFTPLSRLTSSINLGQGAPGWPSPQFVKDAIRHAVDSADYSADQYAPPIGSPLLLREILDYYAPRLTPPAPTACDPAALAALVTYGASQAISLACLTFLDRGDEVLLFEPAFDIYVGAIHIAGAVPVYVRLRQRDDINNNNNNINININHSKSNSISNSQSSSSSSSSLCIDYDELRNAITPRTKLVIVNSPHNPTGKVFSRDELARIDDILPPGVLVVSDEVYEHLTYDDTPHVPFASVSDRAFHRTLSVYSAGKTFSATGLKVGWVVAPKRLVDRCLQTHQYTVFAVCHVAQAAVAAALRHARASSYFADLRASYARKRDTLVRVLREAGFVPIVPEGAFFVCAHVPTDHPLRLQHHANDHLDNHPNHIDDNSDHTDTHPQTQPQMPPEVAKWVKQGVLTIDHTTTTTTDYNVCRQLTVHYGVAAIPMSAFCPSATTAVSNNTRDTRDTQTDCIIRFAFCHPDERLEEAGRRLRERRAQS